jgi:RNA polymerase sigma-70 factor (ECF subfamily)
MAQLNRPQREVVGLVLIDGLTYQEASIALGIPVGTVRSRVSRARRILENTLAVTVPSVAASVIAIAAGHAPGS